MTVRLVGGGGVRCWFLRMPGPESGMMSVSSPAVCVLGGALAGGGGGASAGGKVTVRWAWAGAIKSNKMAQVRHKDLNRKVGVPPLGGLPSNRLKAELQ